MPPVSIPFTLAPGAHAPTRATPGAAGMDLHAYVPHGCPIAVPPGQRVRIRTGVSVALPAGYEGQVRPRSGLAYKHGLTVLNSPGTIDADYRGEVAVILVNHGGHDVIIEHGDRIAQLVVCPVADVALCPADTLPPTQRGSGGFGSTGTGPVDDDRARLEARVRALEAEVVEARAERDQWAAELDALRGERAAVVAWLRHGRWVEKSVHMRHEYDTPVSSAIHDAADIIERGEHRAGGAQ